MGGIDIGRAFGYVTEDEQWITKLLIGALIVWIPIANFAVLGYSINIARNVSSGNPQPLPDWGEFGDHFMKGLYYIAIALGYTLPLIVVSCLIGFVAGLASGNDGGAIALVASCLNLLISLVAIVLTVFIYAALVRYIQTDSLSAAFQFGEVIGMVRANPGRWIMVVLVSMLFGIVGGLGVLACGIGVLFTYAYALFGIGQVLGQVAATQGGGAGLSNMGGMGGPGAGGSGFGPPPNFGGQ